MTTNPGRLMTDDEKIVREALIYNKPWCIETEAALDRLMAKAPQREMRSAEEWWGKICTINGKEQPDANFVGVIGHMEMVPTIRAIQADAVKSMPQKADYDDAKNTAYQNGWNACLASRTATGDRSSYDDLMREIRHKYQKRTRQALEDTLAGKWTNPSATGDGALLKIRDMFVGLQKSYQETHPSGMYNNFPIAQHLQDMIDVIDINKSAAPTHDAPSVPDGRSTMSENDYLEELAGWLDATAQSENICRNFVKRDALRLVRSALDRYLEIASKPPVSA